MSRPGKKIKSILEELGQAYTIKSIDWEWCIYRDLGNGYDVEVSGLDNRRKKISCTVFVWHMRGRIGVVEQIKALSLEELKAALEHVAHQYCGEEPNHERA